MTTNNDNFFKKDDYNNANNILKNNIINNHFEFWKSIADELEIYKQNYIKNCYDIEKKCYVECFKTYSDNYNISKSAKVVLNYFNFVFFISENKMINIVTYFVFKFEELIIDELKKLKNNK